MTDTPALPQLGTILFERRGRLLVMTLNRPDAMNAVNLQLHDDLLEALWFAQGDSGSDVLLVTGAGRAFSAGGDIDHIERNATHPELFDHEARIAKRIVFTMLDIDKPVVCRMNGHAVGLGATLALLCDIVIASDKAKIGDPHVGLGLVAGDGGAVLWAARIGLARAKEFLFTGDLLAAPRAAEVGLINHAVAPEALDGAVDALCAKLLATPMPALRATKMLTNLETKRVAHALMDAGIAYESLSVRSDEHRAAVAALKARLAK
ncbi:MAG: enoyl-CoA hydratase/isomerase family protein [Sphingomonadales bacterium]|nr:enoyl-CoA hydratase/isomerase family protein [Sphingomonadales bacterium]